MLILKREQDTLGEVKVKCSVHERLYAQMSNVHMEHLTISFRCTLMLVYLDQGWPWGCASRVAAQDTRLSSGGGAKAKHQGPLFLECSVCCEL